MNRDHLSALSEMKDYKVSEEDPDVRGWDVVASDGQPLGTVRDLLIDTSRMKVEYFAVTDGAGEEALLPAESAHVDTQLRHVLVSGATAPHRAEQLERAAGYSPDEARLTRAEEEVRIGKREVQAGEVLVGKHVETDRVRGPR